MERSLHGDHLLLGYGGTRRSLGSPKIPFRNSDIDFNDVFGGPPTRLSVHDWRQAPCETLGSDISRGEEEETISYRDPWTGLREKPAFGEESLNRRRRQTNDFYDDIFGGKESLSSTPKRSGLDPLSSTPASGILSPARPLPAQTEPFLSSSLPPMFSLQGKFTKETDFPAFATPNSSPRKNKAGGLGSPISSGTSMSRFSTQVVPGKDGSRNDPQPFYPRQSSLSKDFSFNSNKSPIPTKVETNDQVDNWKKKLSMLSCNDSSSQFHFSIYKWASKGVPIRMLLQGRNISRAKESGKAMNTGTEEPAPVSQGVEFSSISENKLEETESFRLECENQDNRPVISAKKKDGIDSSKKTEEVSSAISDSKSVTNLQSMIPETTNLVPHNVGKVIGPSFGAPLEMYLSSGTAMEKLVSNKEEHRPERETLQRLFKDDSNRQGNVNTVEQPRVREGKVQSSHTPVGDVGDNEKVITGNGKILNLKKESKSRMRDSPTDSEEKIVGNKVKGKVREFVKLFNQEAPAKPINNTGSRSQRSGIREKSICKAEDQANVGSTRDIKEKLTTAMDNGKLNDTLIMLDQAAKDPVKPPLSINSNARKIGDNSCETRDSSLSCSGSIPEVFEYGIGNIEESHCADVHCQVQELSHEEEIRPQDGQNKEKILDADARIRHWSNGKEGNIRSLLSTLQYVLWPESGWKPVPLVDIVEGNSVKRAYQKALLCLHPDKLQQKGAAPHQKYIAEKVFDVLQEAWTHFDYLGSFGS